MDFRKASLLVHSSAPDNKTIPKLRKKLQKQVNKQKSNLSWRLGTTTTSSTEASSSTNKPETTPISKKNPVPLPPPDLSDSKWTEFFRGARCIYPHDFQSAPGSQEQLRNPAIVPELSHLVGQPRKSTSSDTAAAAVTQRTTTTTTRRRAKTPIFSIGQLEDIPRPTNALGKTSSVELIAEQYRALLESADDDSDDLLGMYYSDSYSEPPVHTASRQSLSGDHQHRRPLSILRRQASSGDLRHSIELPRRPDYPGKNNLTQASTSSSSSEDDGTLVSFEEEMVYFKPVSFSPELPEQSAASTPAATATADNLSLQICLDLLTRDLSSALASRPSRSSPETSALQVWVMIEAYEKLRERLLGEKRMLGYEEAGVMEGMLSMWLKALYSIHDKLTEGAGSGGELIAEDVD